MYQGGYQIGPLTTESYNTTNFWQANNAETYYTWSTGNEDYNRLETLRAGNGTYATFDPPLSFSYTHLTANDLNGSSRNDGKQFRVEFDGFSVNLPCSYNQNSDQWEPIINIKDGVLMGPNGVYVIKGTEEAMVMSRITDPGTLAGISFTTQQIGAPTLQYDSTKTDLVGNVPTGVQLKVIKGEVLE
jgi:hypothetical protein